ncbi:hypothetical protein [Amycolatopsis anabasis]|uniref:hypothetical protein n=1 Tax=Amycolatopsis anabasis TaxID=1840409 RepID=UPI00131B2710|nr:hypothetical protein [Amycolatopsis anabasis]
MSYATLATPEPAPDQGPLYRDGVSLSVDASAHLIAELRKIKVRQSKLSETRRRDEALLKGVLAAGGASIGTVGGTPVVSCTTTLRVSLVQKTLKERYPQIFEECSDISEVTTFKLLG